MTGIQSRLLDLSVELLKPEGRILFITCSLLDEEGAGQVDAFLRRERRVRAEGLDLGAGEARGAGVRLEPLRDGTDGFYCAKLRMLSS